MYSEAIIGRIHVWLSCSSDETTLYHQAISPCTSGNACLEVILAFLFLNFPRYNFSPIFFLRPTCVHFSYTFGDWENEHCVIRGPTERWSGPELHSSSYPVCSHSSRGHEDASSLINITLSFPHGAWCHLQMYPNSRRGKSLDIPRTIGSWENDLAYLSNSCGLSPLGHCPPATLTLAVRVPCVGQCPAAWPFTSFLPYWDLLP